MYLKIQQVKSIIIDAIYNRKVLKIKYQKTDGSVDIIESIKAPFDIGTTNIKNIESFKNNLYAFCFNHTDKRTGYKKQIVHPISALHIISIRETDEIFDPVKLTDINKRNSLYDYRKCKWAIAKDRDWYS